MAQARKAVTRGVLKKSIGGDSGESVVFSGITRVKGVAAMDFSGVWTDVSPLTDMASTQRKNRKEEEEDEEEEIGNY